MKFNQIDSFQSYIKSSPKKRLFLIVSADDFERHALLEKTAATLPHENAFSINRFMASHSIEEVISSMNSLSLLGGSPLVVLDEVETRKKRDIDLLLDFLRRQNQDSFLVLGAKYKKSISPLLSFFDKEGIVVDLTSEKIWDKEKRYISHLMQKCAKEKKSVAYDALQLLVQKVGLDAAFLEHEMEKVITYVGDKATITKEDISAVCLSSMQYSLWQIAEKVVWKQEFDLNFSHMEASFFHGLISSLRLQLQQGLKMAALIEKKAKAEDFSNYFPRIYPRQLERKKQTASTLGKKWFQNALIGLFEIDLSSKNNVGSFSLLWDLFCSKLRMARR